MISSGYIWASIVLLGVVSILLSVFVGGPCRQSIDDYFEAKPAPKQLFAADELLRATRVNGHVAIIQHPTIRHQTVVLSCLWEPGGWVQLRSETSCIEARLSRAVLARKDFV